MIGREVALKALQRINNEGAYTNIVIQDMLGWASDIDRSFVTNIIYGTIKNQIYIDYIISKTSNSDFDRIDASVLNILRMSVYQIFYMDKVPESAVCNEAVKLTKQYSNEGSARFVNAVLRNIIRSKAEYEDLNIKNDVKRISVKYSYPKWMVRMWAEQYGIEFTEEYCKASNEPAQFVIRVNTLKISVDELKDKLEKNGILVDNGLYIQEALIVKSPVDVNRLEEYKNGYFVIQDESSMIAVKSLDVKQDDTILDICAAPGGKTTYTAQLMNNCGKIIARDIYEKKVDDMKQRAEALGIKNIEFEVFDAEQLDEASIDRYDKVIADIPCSGLGVIRRKPDIKLKKTEIDTEAIINIQRNILINAAKYVKIGGVLLYSTCTLNENENDLNLQWFLEQNKNFEVSDLSLYVPESLKSIVDNGIIQLSPNITNTDGFFISRLIRKA